MNFHRQNSSGCSLIKRELYFLWIRGLDTYKKLLTHCEIYYICWQFCLGLAFQPRLQFSLYCLQTAITNERLSYCVKLYVKNVSNLVEMFEKMSEKSVMHLSGKINALKMGRRSLVSSFFKWKCYKELWHS